MQEATPSHAPASIWIQRCFLRLMELQAQVSHFVQAEQAANAEFLIDMTLSDFILQLEEDITRLLKICQDVTGDLNTPPALARTLRDKWQLFHKSVQEEVNRIEVLDVKQEARLLATKGRVINFFKQCLIELIQEGVVEEQAQKEVRTRCTQKENNKVASSEAIGKKELGKRRSGAPSLDPVPSGIHCQYTYAPSISRTEIVIEIEQGATLPPEWDRLLREKLTANNFPLSALSEQEEMLFRSLIQSAPSAEIDRPIQVNTLLENCSVRVKFSGPKPPVKEPESALSAALLKLQKQFNRSCDRKLFDLYIPALSQEVGRAEGSDLLDVTLAFLRHPKQLSCLVLGDSGLGKTTFAKYLAHSLWQHYKKEPEGAWVPLLINLPIIQDPVQRQHRLLAAFFKQLDLSKKQRVALLDQAKLLVLLDGYDEIPERKNLWLSNHWPIKNFKVITFCRLEVLLARQEAASYQELFYPPLATHNLSIKAQGLQERRLQPFTIAQIDHYLQKYVKQRWPETSEFTKSKDKEDKGREKMREVEEASSSLERLSLWQNWQTYRHYINRIPSLAPLVENPFILSMVVQVLPEIIDKEYASQQEVGSSRKLDLPPFIEAKPLTRTQIYDYFVKSWFTYQAQRILQQAKEFPELIGELATYLRLYTENLAYRLLREGKLEVVVDEEDTLDIELLAWREEKEPHFYTKDKSTFSEDFIALIRSGCLLKTELGGFSFLHKSLLEYFAANELFTGLIAGADFVLWSLKEKVLNTENQGRVRKIEARGAAFNEQLLVEEAGILQVLADRVKQDERFKTLLFSIIEHSKEHAEVAIAASNAITILSRARISLSCKDFRKASLRGADLSRALLVGTDFAGADLSGASLNQAYMAKANLSCANLTGVKFGQLPALLSSGRVRCISYSPNGKFIAMGSEHKVQLWEMPERRKIATLTGHEGLVYALSFRPDGALLASAGDKSVRLWQVPEGRQLAVLYSYSYKETVRAVAFSPDGLMLASGGYNKSVRLWQVSKQRQLAVLIGHEDEIYAVAFSPDGSLLASSSKDGSVRLWQVSDRCQLAILTGHGGPVYAVAFSPDGSLLASSSDDKSVRLWKISERRLLAVLNGHEDKVLAVAFSLDGLMLASGSYDNSVRLWEVSERRPLATLAHRNSVSAVAFNSDRTLLASGSNGSVRLWQLTDQYPFTALTGHVGRVRSVTFSPGGTLLASGSMDGSVRLWQVSDQRLFATLTGHREGVESVTFSSDGTLLASGSREGVRLWQVPDRRELAVLTGHKNSIRGVDTMAIAFSPDGLLLALSTDNKIVLWQVSNRRRLATLAGHKGTVYIIAFSPDGSLLASSCAWSVRLWRMSDQSQDVILTNHMYKVRTIAFSPDGSLLALSIGRRIALWQVSDRRKLATLTHPENFVKAVAFSPDGLLLASGDSGASVRLWQLATGRCITELPSGNSDIAALYWHSAAPWLTVIDRRLQKYIWDLSCANKACFALFEASGYYPFTCMGANIEGAVGLSASNLTLLQQQGAVGQPTARQSFYRSQMFSASLFPLASQPEVALSLKSVVKPRLSVSYDQWVLSLLYPAQSDQYPVVLFLEGLSAFGKAMLISLRLIHEEALGKVVILTYPNVAEEDREDLFKREIAMQQEYYCASWTITRGQALSLLQEAKEDQEKKIQYPTPSSTSTAEEGVNNSYLWVREKLHHIKNARIELPETPTKSLGSKINFRITPEGSDKKCLTM